MRRERTTPGTGRNAARMAAQARLRDEAADDRRLRGEATMATWGLRNREHRDLVAAALREPELHVADRETLTAWLAWLRDNAHRSLTDQQERAARRALRMAMACRFKGRTLDRPTIAPPRLAAFLTDPTLLPKKPPGKPVERQGGEP